MRQNFNLLFLLKNLILNKIINNLYYNKSIIHFDLFNPFISLTVFHYLENFSNFFLLASPKFIDGKSYLTSEYKLNIKIHEPMVLFYQTQKKFFLYFQCLNLLKKPFFINK